MVHRGETTRSAMLFFEVLLLTDEKGRDVYFGVSRSYLLTGHQLKDSNPCIEHTKMQNLCLPNKTVIP